MAKRSVKAAIARGVKATLGDEFKGALRDTGSGSMPRVIPSGILGIDVATGIGGYPEGRFIVAHGDEAGGKTTQGLHAIAEVQKLGGVGVLLDFERKLDLVYARAIGVNTDELCVVHPKYIEQGFTIMERTCAVVREQSKDAPLIFVWDSLQGAIARRTSEQEWDDEGYPPEARAYSRGMAKFNPTLSDSRAILFGISQVRATVGGAGPGQGKRKIGVGKSASFYASIIFLFRSSKPRGRVGKSSAREGEDREGNDVEILTAKNQVGRPFTVARVPILFGKGFDPGGDTLNAALAVGLAHSTKKGWYEVALDEETVFAIQGVSGMRKIAETRPDDFEKIRRNIRERIGKVSVETLEKHEAEGFAEGEELEEGEDE
jgi:recombination protein RecA